MQVERLAQEAGPLVEALPRSLRRSVEMDKVPTDLREDCLWLATRIEPYVAKVKSQLAQLPEKTDKALEKADQIVENVSEVRAELFRIALDCTHSMHHMPWLGQLATS